jgi:hypothetical protein
VFGYEKKQGADTWLSRVVSGAGIINFKPRPSNCVFRAIGTRWFIAANAVALLALLMS